MEKAKESSMYLVMAAAIALIAVLIEHEEDDPAAKQWLAAKAKMTQTASSRE